MPTWNDIENSPDFNWSIYEQPVHDLSAFIEEHDRKIFDLGAGQMFLRDCLLDRDINYVPIDFKKRSSDTVLCDFNKGEFPDGKADIAFCSEILEYVEDCERFLKWATDSTDKILLSYNAAGINTDKNARRNRAFLNNLTAKDIVHSLSAKGFLLDGRSNIPAHEDDAFISCCFVRASPQTLRRNFYCNGCGVCANVCLQDAIRLTTDVYGFFKPEFDESKCISCGKCTGSCPTLHVKYSNSDTTKYYAFTAENGNHKHSESGGAFGVLCEEIINRGGIIAGIAYDSNMSAYYEFADSKETSNHFHEAIYQQIRVGFIYRNIERELKTGKLLLFIACPCHVAGLYAYLDSNYDNLYSVDLLCRYTPSQKHFLKYAEENFSEESDRDEIAFISKNETDIYYRSYTQNMMLPKHCEHCMFSGKIRQGDITLGSFENIAAHDPSLDNRGGTGLLLGNNAKGKGLLTVIGRIGKIFTETPPEWQNDNPCIRRYLAPHGARDRFFEIAEYMAFNKASDYAIRYHWDLGLVGLLDSYNYGSYLTYYALYHVLNGLGISSIYIGRPRSSIAGGDNTRVTLFRRNPYPYYVSSRIRNNKTEMRELNYVVDMFCLGSDQLLTWYLFSIFDHFVQMDWVLDSRKKIAYAASFGRDDFTGPEEIRAEMSYFFKKFDAVSLREESGVSLMHNKFDVDATWVLDPVFLLDRKYWHTLILRGKRKMGGKKYVAAYILDSASWKEDLLTAICNKIGLEPWTFGDFAIVRHTQKGTFLSDVNREALFNEDWLRCIAESEFVVADSFHGLCFAIIFRKPFIILGNIGRGLSRFQSILGLFGLQDRLFLDDSDKDIGNYLTLDYSRVEPVLAREINRSIKWLREAVTPPPPPP